MLLSTNIKVKIQKLHEVMLCPQHGTARSSVSVMVTHLVMEEIEQRVLSAFEQSPIFYIEEIHR